MKKPALLLLAMGVTVAMSTAAWAGPQDDAEMARKRADQAAEKAAQGRSPAASQGTPVSAATVAELRNARGKKGNADLVARSGSSTKDIEIVIDDTTGSPTFNRPVTGFGSLSGIGTAVPYNVHAFSVSANDNCSVSLENGSGQDTFLLVYANSFDPLDALTNGHASDDDGGVGADSLIAATALAAGTPYFAVATGFSNTDDGAYTLTINCPVANVSLTGAGVTLTTGGSASPVLVAQELIIPPDRAITNNGRFNINTEIGYAFSSGEVRYARVHCPGVEFTSASVIDFTGDVSNTIGAVNGVGTDAIYFSITAGATPVIATDGFTVDGDRTLAVEAPVDCTYGLYDFPSQAQAGGATGRVATTSGQYVRFGPSYAMQVNNNENAVADVESADPAYSEFVPSPTTLANVSAQIGGFSIGNISAVQGTTQPITLDGNPVDMSDLMSLDSTLTFHGDFSTAGLVYFSFSPDCSTLAAALDYWDGATAYYTGWNFTVTDLFLCHFIGGAPMPVSDFTITFDADSADPSTYAVTSIGPEYLGQISRNGAVLQAPLAQVPAGYLSRMVLTNTGSADRDYKIEVLGETGNVISTANLTGIVPAEGTLVVDLNTVLTGFTASPRATLVVTVEGPNKQIQGLYQIVNPDSGSVSNHVMVRPGSN